jgi:hypothetical protein
MFVITIGHDGGAHDGGAHAQTYRGFASTYSDFRHSIGPALASGCLAHSPRG